MAEFVKLHYLPPYNWDHQFRFLKSHQIYGSEIFTDGSYVRFFIDEVSGQLASVKITHNEAEKCLNVEASNVCSLNLEKVCRKLRRMFDLDSDPILIAKIFSESKFLSGVYQKHLGIRIPSGWDIHEIVICTILGQFVSVPMAAQLVKQLVTLFGKKVILHESEATLFPTAQVLADADLTPLKTTTARKQTIITVSKMFADENLNQRKFEAKDFREKLLKIKGIGPWTAQYATLRALGDPDAMPEKDLFIARILKANPNINHLDFSPWRSYLTLCLWEEFATQFKKKSENRIKLI